MNKAIFLDRDGTLNEDSGYVHKVEDFKLLPGVIEGLNLLKKEYIFFIITNQSGIGKGYYTEDDFWEFNSVLINELERNNIKIEKTYVCPHTKDMQCDCRKPKTKFIKDIVSEHGINLKNSWMIGDHPSDVQLGINAGCRTVYLLTGHGVKHKHELEEKRIKPDFKVTNFLDGVKKIIQEN
ncbi:MAG: HAD family hydrolase [Candidatus Lokiarchaeota archaeon]